jgi:DNA-binding NarL/FixJ family response regulator
MISATKKSLSSTHYEILPIFIIDDHPVIIDGIKNWFRPSRDHIEIAGAARDIVSAEHDGIPERVKVIVLDLYLGFTDPVSNFLFLKKRYPDKPIIILSNEESNIWRQKMYDLGASAYVLKTATREEFKYVIESSALGRQIFSLSYIQNTNGRRSEEFLKDMIPENLGLTGFEKDIICRLIAGQHPKKISNETNLNISRIHQTLYRLRKRFNSDSNIQLAIEVYRHSKP